MDVKNINVFTEVIVSTFETAINSAPFRCDEFAKYEGDINNRDDLMCTIVFSGTLTGAIVITFPEATAKYIYKALMFEEAQKLGEEQVEAFTEILNMVIGNVKAAMSGKKVDFEAPKIEIGKKAKFVNAAKLKILLVPMAFKDWGKFNLYIGVSE